MSSIDTQVTVTKAVDPSAQPKPGKRTSEFYFGIAAAILVAFYSTGVIPTTGAVATIAAIAATVLTQLGYTVSRTLVKTAAAVLLFVGVIGMQVSCSAPQRSAIDHAALDCAESEGRAEAVKVITPVVTSLIVNATSADGLKVDTTPLKSAFSKANLLTETGKILLCSMDRAFAILTTPAAPTTGTPAAAALVIDPTELRRARAEVMAAIAPGVAITGSGR